MLNKYKVLLVPLLATGLTVSAVSAPITDTIYGVEHICSEEDMCWAKNMGWLTYISRDALYYLDAEIGRTPKVSIVSNNIYQVWVKTRYAKPKDGVAYISALHQVNVSDKSYRRLSVYMYDKKGNVKYTFKEPTKWEYAPPGTPIEQITSIIAIVGGGIKARGAELTQKDFLAQ